MLPVWPVDSPCHVYNVYGTTEVSCWAMLQRVERSWLELHADVVMVPLGRALSGTLVAVTDGAGGVLMRGTGVLHIGGPNRRCIVEGETLLVLPIPPSSPPFWRNTGDLATIGDQGVITWAGRCDNRVKRLGQQVNLDSVQQLISSSVIGINIQCISDHPNPSPPSSQALSIHHHLLRPHAPPPAKLRPLQGCLQ